MFQDNSFVDSPHQVTQLFLEKFLIFGHERHHICHEPFLVPPVPTEYLSEVLLLQLVDHLFRYFTMVQHVGNHLHILALAEIQVDIV